MDERQTKEIRRLTRLVKKANPDAAGILKDTITNCAWLKCRLEDAVEAIADSPITVEYDNGGGQTGVRENPCYKAYEGIWQAYNRGVKIILDTLPKAAAKKEKAQTEASAPKNVLELVRSKYA